MPHVKHAASEPTVLVTGATGFLGQRLVDRLLADHRDVTILGRTPAPELQKRGARFIQASLEDKDRVRAACAGIGTIFHVAAKVGVWGRYDEFYRVNVLGTRALLEGAKEHGVGRFIFTSTPSVVYNGHDLAGARENLPLTRRCPSPYPLTKAMAERDVLAAHTQTLATIALRPHLVWGVGDPHLVPRILARARSGRLRIIGDGSNRVDMVHVENAVDAHVLAEATLRDRYIITPTGGTRIEVGGRAYFITNDEPVVLWDWINALLRGLNLPTVTRRMSLKTAVAIGGACEWVWRSLRLEGEPPLTRFVATELAKDHWFDITAAKRELAYLPRISMAEGTAELVDWLRSQRL